MREEYRRFFTVKSLFVVVGNGKLERVAQVLERRTRATVACGTYERFEVELGYNPDELLIKYRVAKVAENTLTALEVEIKVVAGIGRVFVYAVKIKADEHLVCGTVEPLENDVGISDDVVVVSKSHGVRKRHSVLVRKHVAVRVLELVRIRVQVRP